MRARRIALLLLAVLLSPPALFAQAALERLEKQLQLPAVQPPPKEQGYLGLITRHDSQGNFIRVVRVVADSPAAQAGVRADDVILSIDGRLTRGMNDLAAALQGRLPGDRLSVALLRGQEERTLNVTLGHRAPAADGPLLIAPQPNAKPIAAPQQPAAPMPEIVAPVQPATTNGDAARLDLLERRMAELERRLAELERLLSRRP